jgi:hypothetical protein
MSVSSIHDEVISLVENLPVEQVAVVLEFINSIQPVTYNEEDDPLLNGELLFSASPDLGERTKDILAQGFGLKSENEPE